MVRCELLTSIKAPCPKVAQYLTATVIGLSAPKADDKGTPEVVRCYPAHLVAAVDLLTSDPDGPAAFVGRL